MVLWIALLAWSVRMGKLSSRVKLLLGFWVKLMLLNVNDEILGKLL